MNELTGKTAKKIPMRKCVGCNEMKPKRELIRVVRSPEGTIFLDRTGKANGRGAYLCPSAACLKQAKKRRSLQRAFACAVDEAILKALEGELQ
jgi:predicted RNA-binding protein YlxR (DUF448 family)